LKFDDPMSDSFDSFDDFFSSGKSETSKMANLEVIVSQLFNFSEKMFTQLATIIDQLDAKVTGFETQLKSLDTKIQNIARAPPQASAPSMPSSPGLAPPSSPGLPSATAPGLPPPPAGGGGLPPLPGLSPPPSSGGGPPGSPPGPGGPGGAPGSDTGNPLMVRAQLQNELAEAFKKIRANLKEDE
jgi:hypothetical protein